MFKLHQTLTFAGLLVWVVCVSHANSNDQLNVVSVTPSCIEVPVTRGEILIEFSKPMVPFGRTDMDLEEVPVQIKPRLSCTWRWSSNTQLTCTHSDYLKYSTTYSIEIDNAFEATDGTELVAAQTHTFKTASLGVVVNLDYWYGPARPIAQLAFSQPIDLRTVLTKVHFRNSSTNDAIGIKLSSTEIDFGSHVIYRQNESGKWLRLSETDAQHLKESLRNLRDENNEIGIKLSVIASSQWNVEPEEPLDLATSYEIEVLPEVTSIFATEPTRHILHASRFATFSEFEVVGLECEFTDGTIHQHLIHRHDQDELAGCDPDLGVTLLFNTPIKRSQMLNHSDRYVRIHPDPVNAAQFLESPFSYSTSEREPPYRVVHSTKDISSNLVEKKHRKKIFYRLKGMTSYELFDGYSRIHDIFERPLAEFPDLEFRTGNYKPKLNFYYRNLVFQRGTRNMVFQRGTNPKFSVEFANLDSLNVQVANELDLAQTSEVGAKNFVLSAPINRVTSHVIDIDDWLDEESGRFFALVEPVARIGFGEDPKSLCMTGQVASYNVNARIGYESSLAWVADLEKGKAASDVAVKLIQIVGDSIETLSESKTNEHGIARFLGRSQFPDLSHPDSETTSTDDSDRFVHCVRNSRSTHSLLIEGPLGYSILPLSKDAGMVHGTPDFHAGPPLSVWGHTAQGIYQPGDTLNYKIYIRNQMDTGLSVDRSHRFLLAVEDARGAIVHYQKGIELNEFGSFSGEFQIPEQAVESLTFLVFLDDEKALHALMQEDPQRTRFSSIHHWEAFEVDVFDFNPATIRIEGSLNANEYRLGDVLTLNGQADLLSGGPFSKAPILLDVSVVPRQFRSIDPRTREFRFAVTTGESQNLTQTDAPSKGELTDQKGRFSASFELNVEDVPVGLLSVRAGIQEDNGNVIWHTLEATYISTDRLVGIRQQDSGGEAQIFEAVVVDPKGVPKNDTRITLEFIEHRGQPFLEARSGKVLHSCTLEVDDLPKKCSYEPTRDVAYRAIASITTPDGRIQSAYSRVIYYERFLSALFTESEYVRIANRHELEDLLFNVGEVAQLKLEHTFPGSLALVTTERLGILDEWVISLEDETTNIEIPIEQDYEPIIGVAITVFTVNSSRRPYVLVPYDGQRSFPNSRTEQVRLRVRDPEQVLAIEITTDKEVYEPGERVKVAISIEDSSGSSSQSRKELAVAVVEQGAVELSKSGIDHFDPIQGLLESVEFGITDDGLLHIPNRGLYSEIVNAAVPARRKETRQNKELLSLWLPHLQTDESGLVSFEFNAGDRLTEWKFIVVAAATGDQIGVGFHSFKTNLGIEIHPVLPNQVTDTDQFDAGFMLFNRTDSERNITVEIETSGDVEAAPFQEKATLQPFERKLVSSRTTARIKDNRDLTEAGEISFLVTAYDAEHSDALSQQITVHRRTRLVVSSVSGTSTQEQVFETVQFPTNIKDGTGKLNVLVAPSLINAAEDNIARMRDYPYGCWEQKISTAVVAAHYSSLQNRMNVEWPNSNEYIQEVLQAAVDFQTRNGGFAYWSGESYFADEYLSAYTALAFRWLKDAGHEVPAPVLIKLLRYLEEQVSNRSLDESHYNENLVQSLKLVMANALTQHGKGDLQYIVELLEESPTVSFFALAQSLEAALELGAEQKTLDMLASRIRSGIGVTSDRALIHHNRSWEGDYLLSSTLKTTCNAVSSFVRAHKNKKPLLAVDRLAELVRGVMFELNKKWLQTNTHESSFCLGAVVDYAKTMETSDEDAVVDVELALEQPHHRITLQRSDSHQPSIGAAMFATSINHEFVGNPGKVYLTQQGNSRFYYKATLQYEPTKVEEERENFGIDIRKAYWVKNDNDWIELDGNSTLKRGDVVHVGIYLDIRDQRDFVIVVDPVPGALEPINSRIAKTNYRELAPESELADKLVPKGIEGVWNSLGYSRWGFYGSQVRHDSVRFMSDFLPSGRYRLFWTARVIA
ncbi:MAG: Ig-like domain-containing protein, partial [Gammaproteobacteria bacterium]|nr:Ig-like domain-containing protein [Gammaproteobacteria bacterium]